MKNVTKKWFSKRGPKVVEFDCCQARTIHVIVEIRQMCFWLVEGNTTLMFTAMEDAQNSRILS